MASDTSVPSLLSLPHELLSEIAYLLPKYGRLRLRRVNRELASIATPHAFHSLRVRAHGHEPEHFMRISESEHLRPFVKEITYDTWAGSRFRYYYRSSYNSPSSFFDALPFLSLFRNVDTLHLRFCYDCSDDWTSEDKGTHDFCYRVLDTVFCSLAGTWSEDRQRKIDEALGFDQSFNYTMGKVPVDTPKTPIALKTLTASHLDEFNDPRLTNSEAFNMIMILPSLVDLRLSIAIDSTNRDGMFSPKFPDKYEIFGTLHSTWLQPAIASHLRVLSLYCSELWGWLPRMDFRFVGAGGGLPNLKTLALGNFVFSHEWQIEWFGSLDLEKLYLEGCYVLFQARRDLYEFDHSEVSLRNVDGKEIILSNEGYLAREGAESVRFDPQRLRPPIRWCHILSHWKKTMSNLRVFKMGSQTWSTLPKYWNNASVEATINANLAGDPRDIPSFDIPSWAQPFVSNAFRHFDCPPPGATSQDIYRYGTGFVEDCQGKLPYVFWFNDCYVEFEHWWKDVDAWRERMKEEDWLDDYGEEHAAKLTADQITEDVTALVLLRSTVEARRMASVL